MPRRRTFPTLRLAFALVGTAALVSPSAAGAADRTPAQEQSDRLVITMKINIARIPHLDPADTPEGHENASEAADSYFHPSHPSGLGYLVQRKPLLYRQK